MAQITINIKDDKMAQFIEDMKKLDYVEIHSEDWWESISEKSKQLIKKGQKELSEGKGISNESVRNEIDILLGK